jgi:hypothetical protein
MAVHRIVQWQAQIFAFLAKILLQGDRMSLRKSRPKYSPTRFFVESYNTYISPWKNMPL